MAIGKNISGGLLLWGDIMEDADVYGERLVPYGDLRRIT